MCMCAGSSRGLGVEVTHGKSTASATISFCKKNNTASNTVSQMKCRDRLKIMNSSLLSMTLILNSVLKGTGS